MTVNTRQLLLRTIAFLTACYSTSCASLKAQELDGGGSQKQFQLDADNYHAWRDHILPKPAELNWQKIPWLTTFQDGLLAANDANKPLLFWTMNGHPLGCT